MEECSNNVRRAALLENNCCEGTVFKFTSSAPNGRSRQRPRFKACVLSHGVSEEPRDSVFTEMRMMPRSREMAACLEDWHQTKWLASDVKEKFNKAQMIDINDHKRYGLVKILACETRSDCCGEIEFVEVDEGTVKQPCTYNIKGQNVLEEEPPTRKNRRHLRCGSYREKQKKVEGPSSTLTHVDSSSSTKSEQCDRYENSGETSKCKAVDDRKNKRDCCAQEIQIFAQKKMKCAQRKEQNLCTIRYETMHNEHLPKSEEQHVKQADTVSIEHFLEGENQNVKETDTARSSSKSKQETEEEPQAGYVANLADEVKSGKKGPIEPSDEIGKSSKCIPEQEHLDQLLTCGKGTEVETENITFLGTCSSVKSEFESTCNGPLACSFISLKARIPCIGDRTPQFAEEISAETKTSSMGNGANGISPEDVTQGPMSSVEFLEESSAELHPIHKTEKDPEMPSQDLQGKGGDTEDRTEAVKQEAFDRLKTTVKKTSVISDRVGFTQTSAHVAHHCQERLDVPHNLSPCGTSRIVKETCAKGHSLRSNSELKRLEETGWRNVARGSISKKQWASGDGRGRGTYGVNLIHGRPPKMREELSVLADGFASRLLDWYGSGETDNHPGLADIEHHEQPLGKKDGEHKRTVRRKEGYLNHGPDLLDNIQGGLLSQTSRQVMEQTDLPNIKNSCASEIKSETDRKLVNVGAEDDGWRTGTQKHSSRDIDANLRDRQYSAELCTSRSGKVRIDAGYCPQKKLPLRRQTRVKSFKKRTGETVSYFESWLGRGKKDASSLRLYKKSIDSRCGRKEGDLSDLNGVLQLNLDSILDASHHSVSAIERSVPQAWSTLESQGFVTEDVEHPPNSPTQTFVLSEERGFTSEGKRSNDENELPRAHDGFAEKMKVVEVNGSANDSESAAQNTTDICQFSCEGRSEIIQPNDLQIEVGSRDENAESCGEKRTKNSTLPEFAVEEFGDCFTGPGPSVHIKHRECSNGDCISKNDTEGQFPASCKLPGVIGISEHQKITDSVNRRHTMPIIVRVKNGLANGWLLQRCLWKRVARQKMKTGEFQDLGTERFSQKEKERHMDNAFVGHGSMSRPQQETHHGLIGTSGDNELQTAKPEKLASQVSNWEEVTVDKFSAQHVASADRQAIGQNHLGMESRRSRQASSGECEAVEQGQCLLGEDKSKQAASVHHDADNNQVKLENGHHEASSVVRFAEWQSQAGAPGESSVFDGDNRVIVDVGIAERERQVALSRKFSECADSVTPPLQHPFCEKERETAESIFDPCDEWANISAPPGNNSATMNCSYCQTEPHAVLEVPEMRNEHTPFHSPDLSFKECSPRTKEGAVSELSPEFEMSRMVSASIDQHDNRHIHSSLAFDDCGGQSLDKRTVEGLTHMPIDVGNSISWAQLENATMRFPDAPPVDNLLNYLAEPKIEISAPPLFSPHQSRHLVEMAEHESHNSLPRFVGSFSPKTISPPFCPPHRDMNSSNGKRDSVRQDSSLQHSATEDSKDRGAKVPPTQWPRSDDRQPVGLNHWELMEMTKLLKSTEPTLSYKPKTVSSIGNPRNISSSCERENAWDSYYHGNCDATVYWRDELANRNSKDISSAEQVFLDRFSADRNVLNFSNVTQTTSATSCQSNSDFESLAQCNHSSFPDLSTRSGLLSLQQEVCTPCRSFTKRVESASESTAARWITSHPCSSTPPASQYTRRSHSHGDGYNRFEFLVPPDYQCSSDSQPPRSLKNGCLEKASERKFTTAQSHTTSLNRSDEREAWDQYADEAHDWKAFPTQDPLPSLMMRKSSFPTHYQNLPLKQTCHTSNSTHCRFDHCKHRWLCPPPAMPNCHGPPCKASVSTHSRCQFGELNRPMLPSTTEPLMFAQPMSPCFQGCGVQCVRNNVYCPQIMETREVSRSWPNDHSHEPSPLLHDFHQFVDKNSAAHAHEDTGLLTSNSTCKEDHKNELLWLSQEEMHLVQQLRSSGGKAELDSKWRRTEQASLGRFAGEDQLVAIRAKPGCSASAVCRHDAAVCIQRNWRKYSGRKERDVKLEQRKASALSLLADLPMWHDHMQYYKLHQAALSSSEGLRHGKLAKGWYATLQKAASTIQRAWRALMWRKKQKVSSARECPKELKNFYDMVKSRHISRGLCAPPFESFAKSVQRIQAATEGARVRRRLKSRRLQTIIMEIKEIRMLLGEMSQEAKCDSTPYLFPQLCTQLQQKMVQLHTALNGQQTDARFLLRRCSATPLVMCPARSNSSRSLSAVSVEKLGDQDLVKMSSSMVYTRPCRKQSLITSSSTMVDTQSSTRLYTVPAKKKMVRTGSSEPPIQGLKDEAVILGNSSQDALDMRYPLGSAKLLPWYILAQTSSSDHTGGQGTLINFHSRHEANANKEKRVNLYSALSSAEINFTPSLDSPKASLKPKDMESVKNFDEQPIPQSRNINEMPFEERVVGGSNTGMYLTEYTPSTDLSDKPKRPFLKRKSIVMPSQKLDWSKVKPMVSSRLEPELKTKLSFCKVITKDTTKKGSQKKKANYTLVKSRLFSYEENLSPRTSREGISLRGHTKEACEAYSAPMLRSLTKGSSIQGTDNGRALENRQRNASPDLMRLKWREQDTVSNFSKQRSQTPILDNPSVASYNSCFDSASYLHKLENSEQAGSRQQQTHRIRLRIMPRSKENEIDSLFVQEINLKEEMQEISKDYKHTLESSKRPQSHSHRYAI